MLSILIFAAQKARLLYNFTIGRLINVLFWKITCNLGPVCFLIELVYGRTFRCFPLAEFFPPIFVGIRFFFQFNPFWFKIVQEFLAIVNCDIGYTLYDPKIHFFR